jgi:hypothetical protein
MHASPCGHPSMARKKERAPQDDGIHFSRFIIMASLHRDIPINASPEHVWAVVRDFGAVKKLAPGFVIEAKLDGDTRIVTFANGNVAREMLVDCDEARWRLVYAIGK